MKLQGDRETLCGLSCLGDKLIVRNKYELNTNLKDMMNERNQWRQALASNTAPFALKNQVYVHVQDLDRRIQNLQWMLSAEND